MPAVQRVDTVWESVTLDASAQQSCQAGCSQTNYGHGHNKPQETKGAKTNKDTKKSKETKKRKETVDLLGETVFSNFAVLNSGLLMAKSGTCSLNCPPGTCEGHHAGSH
jgi:hypothetical protein